MRTAPSPYLDGLKMLARRELSETQVRAASRPPGPRARAIDDAVDRLKNEGAIDDARVAEAIARTETTIKRRGRLRVRRQIERAGIAPSHRPPRCRRGLRRARRGRAPRGRARKRLDDREAIARQRRIRPALSISGRAGLRGRCDLYGR